MGGHGGLNILPQKRWNVYGRDNRLKVARDEAAHEAEQAVQREKHRAAEAQARRQLLLERAKQRREVALGDTAGSDSDAADAAAAEAGDANTEAQLLLQQQVEARRFDARDSKRPRLQERQQKQLQAHDAHQQQQQVSTELQEAPVLEHINFWKEFETKAQHPERQAEEKDKKRKRGNPDTYTSDARFDESFKLGYGLTGPTPWYARAQEPEAHLRPGQPAQQNSRQQQQQQLPSHPGQQLQQQQHNRLEALPGFRADFEQQQHRSRKKQRSSRRSNDSTSSESSSSSSSSDSSGSSSDSSIERRRRKRSQRHGSSKDKRGKDGRECKSRKHSKHKDKAKQHKRRSAAGKAAADEDAAKALALAKLRAERLDREAAERTRALQATGLLPPSTKRFNNSYGYADALRQNQGAQMAAAAAAAAAVAAAGRGVPAAAAAGLPWRFKA